MSPLDPSLYSEEQGDGSDWPTEVMFIIVKSSQGSDSRFSCGFFEPMKSLVSPGQAVGFKSGYVRDGRGPRGGHGTQHSHGQRSVSTLCD